MFYSILGPVGYGVANALNKITGTAIGTTKSVILQTFFAIICLFSFGIFYSGFGDVNYVWFVVTFLFGVYGYFPLLFFIKAISKGKIGIIIPIVDLAVLVSLLCAYIFLGQSVSLIGLLFVFLVLAGATLLSINFSDFKDSSIFKKESGVMFAVIAAVLWGVGYFIWSFPTAHIGPLNTSILIEFGVLCSALFDLCLLQKQKLFGTIPKNILKVGILIGVFGAIGTLGTNLSIQSIGVSLTLAIMGARPAVGAMVGYFVFKEKLERKQILALLLIMIGVAGVSLFK
jgi:drug/metabolite transporter (DMT)-like permease